MQRAPVVERTLLKRSLVVTISAVLVLTSPKYSMQSPPTVHRTWYGLAFLGRWAQSFAASGGGLVHVTATQLGITAIKAALQSGGVDLSIIDCVYFGNEFKPGRNAAYVAHHVALASGMNFSTPALTINRLCRSGFETIIQAIPSMKLGEQHVVLGTKNMPAAPLVVDGTTLGKGLQKWDALWDGPTLLFPLLCRTYTL